MQHHNWGLGMRTMKTALAIWLAFFKEDKNYSQTAIRKKRGLWYVSYRSS